MESKITVEDFLKLRTKFSKERTKHEDGIPKSYVEKGLKAAGIRIVSPKPDVESMKPVSPATLKAMKEEPVKVCANCTFAYREDFSCPLGLEPTEENECAVQDPGWPSTGRRVCVYCGGVTANEFLRDLGVDTCYEQTKTGTAFYAHDLCLHDKILNEFDVKGMCRNCNYPDCGLLIDIESGKIDVEVKHCPEWFNQRPDMTIKEINAEVKKRIHEFVTDARKEFEKGKAAGRAA